MDGLSLYAVVAWASLTRYDNLFAHGQLRQHGVYYFANGPFRHYNREEVLVLIARRSLLALARELEAGSSADGVQALDRPIGTTDRAQGQVIASGVSFSRRLTMPAFWRRGS